MRCRDCGKYQLQAVAFSMTPYRNGNPVTPFPLDKPITIELVYLDALVSGIAEDTLRIYTSENGVNQWQPAVATCSGADRLETRDTQANRLTVNVCHLSEFAILGETKVVFLPVIIRQ